MTAESIRPTATFTIFTGTRNRGHTLDRVYRSLARQTFRDFEWLVVDNGSTDGTPELVTKWQQEADFPIRYWWQEDQGKHFSSNRAVLEACGEFFITLDSDDECVPDALERFMAHWRSIPEGRRDRFVGVTGLCQDENGQLVGTRFPFDPTDSNSLEIRFKHHVRGEKWGFQRTSVMRQHLYPVYPGYKGLIPPTYVWNALAREYQTRYVNDMLHIYWHDQPVALSKPVHFADDALGSRIELEESLNYDIAWLRYAPMAFFIKAAKYVRCSLHTGRSVDEQVGALHNLPARALWAAAVPLGLGSYLLDRMGFSRQLREWRARLG